MKIALLVLLLGAAAAAESAEDILFRARHAQDVRGNSREAVKLYQLALEDPSLGIAAQAEVHLRVAICHWQLGEDRLALGHLAESLFARPEVAREVRQRARDLRTRLEERRPRAGGAKTPPAEDPSARRARLLADHLRRARDFLEQGDDIHALMNIQRALELDPNDPEARTLKSELDTRLSGVTEFVRDPLRFVKTWTEAQTKRVAREAEELLQQALVSERAGAYNLAGSQFKEAVETIDECEFADESDELLDLRERIVQRWGALDEHGFGPGDLRRVRARTTYVSDFLNQLQRMLDVVSAPDQEYRILPVSAPAAATPVRSWRSKPPDLQLRRDIPSDWSPALFAHRYLQLRVHPQSWSESGNYLEAVGGMLVARNQPSVLNDLRRELRRIEQPPAEAMRTRFVLVSVPEAAVARFGAQFGEWQRSGGSSPVLYRAVPPGYDLEGLCAFLRDEDADVRLPRDAFDVELANGIAQKFFAALPLSRAAGYHGAQPDRGDPLASHYGVLLDAYPLRDADGRTALLLGVAARLPAPPLEESTPRFLEQRASLFVDLAPGSTLAVAGLVDPFAAGRGEAGRTLILLWENHGARGDAGAGDGEPEQGSPLVSEVPLRNLLLKVRDRPGPKGDPKQGFVPRDPLAVLEERARFLEGLLREALADDAVSVDVAEAVVRIPPALREAAAEAVADLEQQGRASYVVRIQARAVRTQVFERWLEREGLELRDFDRASIALSEAPSAEFLLRNLLQAEPEDAFAPHSELPAFTVLGLQARHALSARSRTSPAYASEDDLEQGEMRMVTEGLRVTVRPYRWRGRLQAQIEVETQALESEVEELALPRAIPSYRTAVAGDVAAGTVDLGDPANPYTALVCRIAHPTASALGKLTEIVVAVSVRPAP